MVQFTPENSGYAKPPSKIRKGMDRNNLIREVTLQIEDSKNIIQIKDKREESSNGK